MKFALLAFVVIAGLLGAVYVSQNQGSGSSTTTNTLVLADGTTIYDVRTQEEYNAGHAKDAILLPLSDIQAGATPDVERDAPIAVYCRSGNRSSQAAQILKEAGYYNITDIGAYGNLAKYGLETTS